MGDATPDDRVELARTFLRLALVAAEGFDVVEEFTEFAASCVALLGAAGAGVLLGGADGGVRLVGSSSEQARLLELFEIQHRQGPCYDCYTSGAVVVAADLTAGMPPRFSEVARAAGFTSAFAVPLVHAGTTLGALNILYESAPPDLAAAIALAQALADAAAVALVNDADRRRARELTARLQAALDSRVVIEQAKGIVAERHGIDLDVAFHLLRQHARNHNLPLTAVAVAVVAGTLRI